MTLTLRAISLNDHPLTQPITAHFDATGGSVGRADHNTLALPDPERHISRQHAEIRASGDGYVIKNVGSANPIIVRGQPVGRGETAPLVHRDQVRIGGYLLEVIQEESGGGEVAASVVRGRAAVDAQTTSGLRYQRPQPQTGSFGPRTSPRTASGGTSAGLGDLSAPLSPSNPFANLLGDPAPAPFGPPGAAPAQPMQPRSPPPHRPMPPPPPQQQSIAQPPPQYRPLTPRPASSGDPFSGLQPAAAGISGSSAAWGSPPPPPVRAMLPDDFDPFAMPAAPAAPKTAPRSGSSSGGGAFDDLIPSAEPASIDHLFGPPGSGSDPLADFMAGSAPSRQADSDAASGMAGVSTDPFAMFGGPASTPAPRDAMPTRRDDVPELRAAFAPPAVRPSPMSSMPSQPQASPNAGREADLRFAPPPPATAVRPAPSPPARPSAATQFAAARAAPAAPVGGAWQGDPEALWAALCEGAGVTIDLPQGVHPDLMRVVGSVLRAAVGGTLQLMMVRATTKHELGADVTMIRARNNNPLKFTPDAGSALEQMLKPPMRGFMAGPEAMTDAMHDLVGHTIGTMAGTRAALEGVLDRFMPQQLEAKLSGKSMLDSLLPMNRKAKLWELYLQHYDAIRNEAHDDFHSLFGRAFLTAYEQQLERLQHDEAGKAPS